MHNASPLYNSAVDNSDEESKSPPRPLTVERLKQHLDELEALRDRRLHDPRLRDPRKKHKMTSLLQRIDRTKTMLHAAEERNREAAPPVPVVDAVASFDGEKWEIKASGGQHFEVDNVAGKKAGHLVLKEIPSDSGGFVGIDTDVIPIRTGKLLEGGALIRHDKGAHSWTFAYLPEKLSL